ncbi:MAG: 30S ribosomal protein S19 [Berkelbacteria bacterium GW2011_GWB1_38_5]|uniref:Small ribosomal subunit protein uS19 n=2 Tax=Candidatus Berkelbacteria TaxID=1618330 RepID=A0A0G0LGF7_9BACT|nr:MAG: 30S ribosomal protein S19 [Berkelbacteria bacterium GW2011_GWB1_38_5]KKQ90973.1 MAG: 30S ribosomal protein S19 [Berkelbacteria bacterium GW2011_GWA1_39_10]
MSRSLKKGPYIDENLIKKIKNLKAGDGQIIKTWARSSVISPEMVGHKIGVHNGREHIPVLIIEDMVGHKLGEFSPTRKFIRHGGRMAKEEEQAVVAKEAQAVKASKEEKPKAESGAK